MKKYPTISAYKQAVIDEDVYATIEDVAIL